MSSHYRHRSKGGILIIPLNPSRGDHAAGNLHFALGTAFQHEDREIEDCTIDVIKATRHNSSEWAPLTSITVLFIAQSFSGEPHSLDAADAAWRQGLEAGSEQYFYVLRQ